ncbi:stalk domain-containing protein [Paenibacillus profundus]|uniref:stalk domain-containing protein n=1 Tax=Paenibacillus profundus TaxID=1173085 RepID=UPI0038994FE4
MENILASCKNNSQSGRFILIFVPLRFVSEALGGRVSWSPDDRICTLWNDG